MEDGGLGVVFEGLVVVFRGVEGVALAVQVVRLLVWGKVGGRVRVGIWGLLRGG